MLGRHLAAALNACGFETIPIGLENNARPWNLTEWKADAELDEIFAAADAVVHAGAAVPSTSARFSDAELFDANVRAVFNVGGWARRRAVPLVHISGAIVYAQVEEQGIRETSPLGWNGIGGTYGVTKLFAEHVLAEEKSAGLKLAVVRPSSIYGYGLAADKMLCSFLSRAKEGSVVEIAEPVNDCVDLIHAADVAGAVVRILEQGAWGTFNVASGRCASVKELADQCVAVAGKGSVRVTGASDPQRKSQRRFDLNSDAAKQLLNWSPRTDLATGLRSMLEQRVIEWRPA